MFNKNKIRLSGDGVFYSLQGEGNSIGRPAVFIRLHACNLRCVWCDTPYAVFPGDERYKRECYVRKISDVAETIMSMWPKSNLGMKRLVITGGEPLIQKKILDKLIDLLPNWLIEIETNGTIMPTRKQKKRCIFNCSPKLLNSGNEERLRYKPAILKALIKLPATTFKFVVSDPKDLTEIEDNYVRCLNIPIDSVILMPLGTKVTDLRKHMQAVAEYAKQKGYRVLSRLQIDIWKNKRKT